MPTLDDTYIFTLARGDVDRLSPIDNDQLQPIYFHVSPTDIAVPPISQSASRVYRQLHIMHYSPSFIVLQILFTLLLDTAFSSFAGAISPSQANTTAASTVHFSMSIAETVPSSLANRSTDTKAAPPTLVESHLNCNPPFPTINEIEIELLAEVCTMVESKISLMTRRGILEERLGHIDPTLPTQLHAIDDFSNSLQTQHSCLCSGREGMPCTWLSQLRGNIASLLAKVGASDRTSTSYDAQALETLSSDILLFFEETYILVGELAALLESRNDRQRRLPIYEKVNQLSLMVERGAVLRLRVCRPEHGMLDVCLFLGKIAKSNKTILTLLIKAILLLETNEL